jgi:hypothetical protein
MGSTTHPYSTSCKDRWCVVRLSALRVARPRVEIARFRAYAPLVGSGRHKGSLRGADCRVRLPIAFVRVASYADLSRTQRSFVANGLTRRNEFPLLCDQAAGSGLRHPLCSPDGSDPSHRSVVITLSYAHLQQTPRDADSFSQPRPNRHLTTAGTIAVRLDRSRAPA